MGAALQPSIARPVSHGPDAAGCREVSAAARTHRVRPDGAPVLGGARRWWYIWCEVRAHAAVRTTGVGRRSRRALVRADAAP